MKTSNKIQSDKKLSENVDRTQRNKDLVMRAVEEVWNGGNYMNLKEFVADDFVVHARTPEEEIHGPEGAREFFTQLRTAFPDIHFTVKDQFADKDRVITHWTATGTHRGEFKGIAPTGRKFSITSIDIDRIVNGKVVECWSHMDELGLLRQLGAFPEHS
jgi:steroid delta-isomerase-like uncharacterized protein